MTNAPIPHSSGAAPNDRRTFARHRLPVGIAGVGTTVALAAAWLSMLAFDLVPLPAVLLAPASPIATVVRNAALVVVVFCVHAVLLLPVEVFGGLAAERAPQRLRAWVAAWLRGVALQGAVVGGVAATLSLATLFLGWVGAVAVSLGAAVGLLALQGVLAQLGARVTVHPLDASLHDLVRSVGFVPDRVRVVRGASDAFVGGWVGLVQPDLWVPAAWTDADHRALLVTQLVRRAAQRDTLAWQRGLVRAAAWPAIGVALLAPLLPWGWDDARLWLALPVAGTLWSFVAMLLLPTASRPTVYSADALAAAKLGVEPVIAAVRTLDGWQDDEPERSRLVEFVFHPVPSLGNRARALRQRRRPVLGGGHQQTRLTLYTSLAGFGLLGRMVHCAVGRPDLWVLYPGD
jgi:hypothetical protein